MKIFFFITKSEHGGAQTHVAQLSTYLLKKGHDIAVMSAPGGWLETETQRIGATFFANPALGNTTNPIRLWRSARALEQAIRVFDPNLVACHSTMSGLVGRFTLRNRIPTVFTAHGWSFTQGAKSYRRFILPTLERIAGRFCEKIICVSHNDLSLALAHHIAPKEKLTVIYNGVENIATKTSSIHDQNSITRILFVGRLAPPKNPSMLLQALPTNCHLTVVGDGPQRAELEQLADDLNITQSVTFTGSLNKEAVQTQYAQADIFVLPTNYEGLPYTILEAMAHGLSVIASDVGGVKEAVGDDAGIVVPPNQIDALKSALQKLITNPDLRKRMGQIGRQKIETKFSIRSMRDRTLACYLDILGEKN